MLLAQIDDLREMADELNKLERRLKRRLRTTEYMVRSYIVRAHTRRRRIRLKIVPNSLSRRA